MLSRCWRSGRWRRRVVVRKRGPVFGVAAGVGEDEGDLRVANLQAGELVCEPIAVDLLELEQGRVSRFDDNCGEWEVGQALQLEGQ